MPRTPRPNTTAPGHTVSGSTERASFNYRHLHAFCAVAHEGSLTAAAARLGMAIQTVSAQVRALERSIGCALLRPAGRGVALTGAGLATLELADRIVALGTTLPERARAVAGRQVVRLAVGVSDGLPKEMVHQLLAPILGTPDLHLICEDGEFDQLLGQLALHHLDVVLSDRPAPHRTTVPLTSHLLGTSALAWYAPPCWADAARADFPRSLGCVPVLLPTTHGAARALIDPWFERIDVQPCVRGEFEDSALMMTFGAAGMGVFPAAARMQTGLEQRFGVHEVGTCPSVVESFHAVVAGRRITHPLVRTLRDHAQPDHSG